MTGEPHRTVCALQFSHIVNFRPSAAAEVLTTEKMRKNQSTLLRGKRVLLVPYRESHVPKYHQWMQDEELQKLTASEPLSLEQEFEMQKTWARDEDKCTFIVLDRTLYDLNKNEVEAMVGDVNLFFHDEDQRSIAEIEIMIAESSARGKGMGKEAALLMMRYGAEELDINKYIAKIGFENEKSLSMFLKLGFKEVSRSEVFQEITLELQLHNECLDWLKNETASFNISIESS